MKDIDPDMLLAMQEVDRLAPNAPPITPEYGPWQDPYYVLGISAANLSNNPYSQSQLNAANQASISLAEQAQYYNAMNAAASCQSAYFSQQAANRADAQYGGAFPNVRRR